MGVPKVFNSGLGQILLDSIRLDLVRAFNRIEDFHLRTMESEGRIARCPQRRCGWKIAAAPKRAKVELAPVPADTETTPTNE